MVHELSDASCAAAALPAERLGDITPFGGTAQLQESDKDPLFIGDQWISLFKAVAA
jgi:hypothetical protein